MILTANGSPTGLTIPGRAAMFGGPAREGAGDGTLVWHDAHTTHPTQFDPFEVDGNGNLIAPPTVRNSYIADPGNPIYPVDPETDEQYSPWIVTHRLMWTDIGIDDDFELHLAWEVLTDVHGFAQVSLAFGIDLDADPYENGCLYAYDISQFGGVSYWHNVPMTPDVASCFDDSYYENLGGSVSMPIASVGRHWWRVQCFDGQMVALFDGVRRHTPVARPAWTVGRTTVGIHVVSMSCPPDANYVGDAALWNAVVSDPPAVATMSSFQWNQI